MRIFKPSNFAHPTLGLFEKRSGYWQGSIKLKNFEFIPLFISSYREPTSNAIDAAADLIDAWDVLYVESEKLLFDHYFHGFTPSLDYPKILNPSDVWKFITPEKIIIEPRKNNTRIEVAIRTEWDIEHTLGIRIKNGHVIELCESI
jgi:hypothetical protein